MSIFKAFISITIIIGFVAAVIGWIFNIMEIADSVAFSGMLVLRAIGVFVAPLGAVLGYI